MRCHSVTQSFTWFILYNSTGKIILPLLEDWNIKVEEMPMPEILEEEEGMTSVHILKFSIKN